MSQTTHTPGPMYPVGTDGEPDAGITGYGVLACPPGDEEGVLVADGCSKADATLFAAAPDLLAELRETVDWLEGRAAVLGDIAAMAGISRHRSPQLRDEAARLQGRAAVIRQTILKATQGD